MQAKDTGLSIRPWSKDDLPLMQKLLGDPEMTRHLGGPETAEQLERRHHKYVAMDGSGTGEMFVILLTGENEPVGSVGYWEKEEKGETVYEMGWSVLPAYQGRGIAVQATLAALEVMRKVGKHHFVHAYPSVENAASNAVCRKAGFTLVETLEFEFPKGHFMQCNDWKLDLGERT